MKVMKKFRCFILLLLCPIFASATTIDCQGVYIGRIWIEKGNGLTAVVYLNHPGNSSGSYWSSFTGWTPAEKMQRFQCL